MKKAAWQVLIVLLSSVAVFGQYTGTVSLGTSDVTFLGENAGDNAGYQVAIIKDINNDTFDEILITAPSFSSSEEIQKNGITYLFYGKADGWTGAINLANADASFVGEEANNQASHDVCGIGDVNNDGYNDFAIGVKFINQSGLRAGKVYIFFGKETPYALNTNLAAADASFLGEGDTSEAAHVNWLGDVNGDNYDDIIIGSGFNDQIDNNAGKVYIIFGKETGLWGTDVSMANADASYLGELADDWTGHRVAGVGDVNGDGYNDFIAGGNRRDIGETEDRGITYLVLGKADGWAQDVSFANADASFLGPDIAKIETGWNVARAGDVNNDDLDDFLIGGAGKSRIYLIQGKTDGWALDTPLENEAATTFIGEHHKDYAGNNMCSLGDVNQDGYDDVIIGAYGNDEAGNSAGKAYIIYGRQTWPAELALSNANAAFIGENAEDFGGWAVGGNGDVNMDGFNDILISAVNNDDNGENAGKVYLFLTPKTEFSLTTPNGGEVWQVGKSYAIEWVSGDPQGDVSVELSRDGGTTWENVTVTPDNGSVNWTVTGPTSDQCLVKITQNNTLLTDQSNAVFSIITPSVTVTSPNGGQVWFQNTSQNITWTSQGDVANVKIELSTDNGATWQTIAESTPNDGDYEWNTPEITSTECLVKVSDVADATIFDQSDAVFTITPQSSITVVAPNGGEDWQIGSQQTIQWTSVGITGDVKISITRDNITTWETILTNTENTGSLNWNVTGPSSADCLVRVSTADGKVKDVSDAVFTISNAPVITVSAPNGGETWMIHETKNIVWTSAFTGETVKIELSRDWGASWEVLSESTENDGTFEWKVTAEPGTKCLIRVSDNETSASDNSDAVFTIDYAAGVEKSTETIPTEFGLNQNYPNPFNPSTTINFNVPKTEYVTIYIYNINGGLVKTLVNQQLNAGHHTIIWNSRDEAGRAVSSGLYFYRMDAGNFSKTHRMLLLK